jgi:hypothetical protein
MNREIKAEALPAPDPMLLLEPHGQVEAESGSFIPSWPLVEIYGCRLGWSWNLGKMATVRPDQPGIRGGGSMVNRLLIVAWPLL